MSNTVSRSTNLREKRSVSVKKFAFRTPVLTLSFSPVLAQDLVGAGGGQKACPSAATGPANDTCLAKLGFVLTKGKKSYIYCFQGKSSNVWSCRS